MDAGLGFFRTIEARARLGPTLKGIDEGLTTGRILGTVLSEACIGILTWTWVLDRATLETFILRYRPVRCLSLVLDRRLIVIGTRDMAEALIIDEFGNYNIQVSKDLCEEQIHKRRISG